jgi:hypothetical protein
MHRWVMVLSALLVLVGFGGCHVLDATPQFVSFLSCGLVACPSIQLTLTNTTVPLHVVRIKVTGTYQTVVMDSGPYVWNLPSNPCTTFTTGTITIPPGGSGWGLYCGSYPPAGLVRLF